MIGPGVAIGNGCKLQNNVSIYKGIPLEENVFCGPSCVFTNVINPRAFVERKEEFSPNLIKKLVPQLALMRPSFAVSQLDVTQ
jgi:UDP-2-acetamido-3-amino-2,3-dideoxy-glucuronate N-acetyltransferase